MVNTVREWRKYFKGETQVKEQLPMNQRTSFRTGGPAELVVEPRNRNELAQILQALTKMEQQPTLLGGCTNVLVADKGIPGVTILMDSFERNLYTLSAEILKVSAGTPISDIAWGLGHGGMQGLEYFYRLPGTLGGALWMNASCYGASIGAVVNEVTYMNYRGEIEVIPLGATDFSYKHSPFQERQGIILDATLSITPGNTDGLIAEMKRIEQDRIIKGHFSYPSAGSVFKNMPNIERPVGSLLDSLGLKGYAYGGASVADYHANIIINRGDATSAEIADIVTYLRAKCKKELGYDLEQEIRYVGAW